MNLLNYLQENFYGTFKYFFAFRKMAQDGHLEMDGLQQTVEDLTLREPTPLELQMLKMQEQFEELKRQLNQERTEREKERKEREQELQQLRVTSQRLKEEKDVLRAQLSSRSMQGNSFHNDWYRSPSLTLICSLVAVRGDTARANPIAVHTSPSNQTTTLNLLVEPPAQDRLGNTILTFGPSVHWMSGYFTSVLHAASVGLANSASSDEEPTEAEKKATAALAGFVDEPSPELLDQIARLMGPVKQFLADLGRIPPNSFEVPLTASFTRAWNMMVAALDPQDWPEDVKRGLIASHLQPLPDKEHVDTYNGMTNFKHAIQNTLKMTEAKRDSSLATLLREVMYQVENQVARMDALHQAATGQELRLPFFQEGFSCNSYYLDLLVPCHRGDPIVKYGVFNARSAAPSTRNSTPEPRIDEDSERGLALDSVMVRIPLARLASLPKASVMTAAFPVIVAQLMTMKEMAMVYLNEKEVVPRTTWLRPTQQLMLEEGWDPMLTTGLLPLEATARPTLLRYQHRSSGAVIMIKLFDYYFRGLRMPDKSSAIHMDQTRQPLARELLAALKDEHPNEYASWQVTRPHPYYSYLQYDRINGQHVPRSWAQFVKVLDIIRTAHAVGYIMGDMLAQNMVFHTDGEAATVIDWDMSRAKESEPKYVKGFIQGGFHKIFRHMDAKAGADMEYVHDAWALASLATLWFEGDGLESWVAKLKICDKVTLELVEEADSLVCERKEGNADLFLQPTGSPVRPVLNLDG